MANQLLGLQIERPRFSYPEAMQNAQTLTRGNQEIEQNRIQGDLAGMKLRDYSEESNALRDYRQAAQGDDPQALDKLKGYPEMQAKIIDALDGMKPDELIKAKVSARAFGEAAAYIKRFQPGSPEERQAWDQVLGKLSADGVIDEATAAHWKQAGPSDLIIDQADMMADLVGGYLKKGKETINEVDQYIDTQIEKLRDDLISDDFTPGPEDMAQIQRQLDEARAQLEKKYKGGNRGIGGATDTSETRSKLKAAEGLTAPVVDEVVPAESAAGNANQIPLGKKPRGNVRTHFPALVVHHENAITISIEDDAAVGAAEPHRLLKLIHRARRHRIRRVAREGAVRHIV